MSLNNSYNDSGAVCDAGGRREAGISAQSYCSNNVNYVLPGQGGALLSGSVVAGEGMTGPINGGDGGRSEEACSSSGGGGGAEHIIGSARQPSHPLPNTRVGQVSPCTASAQHHASTTSLV